jgi:hypothetical protein
MTPPRRPWLALALLPAFAFAASPAASPSPDCIALSGSRILAGELAHHDTRFHRLDPRTDLGYLPDPGERRTISPPESAGPGAAVCVERASRALSAEAVQSALEFPLQPGEVAGIQATVLSFSSGSYPEGTLHFPPGGISPPPAGADQVLWRGTITYEPGRTLAVWAQVALRREGGCLRARRAMRPGQPLAAADTERAPCDAAAILAGALGPAEAVQERVVAMALRQGEWLNQLVLTNPPLVVARREAALRVQVGAARLTLPVIPEQDGVSGDTVWVRVPATRERIQATVVGTDALERRLEPASRSRAGARAQSAENRQPRRQP